MPDDIKIHHSNGAKITFNHWCVYLSARQKIDLVKAVAHLPCQTAHWYGMGQRLEPGCPGTHQLGVLKQFVNRYLIYVTAHYMHTAAVVAAASHLAIKNHADEEGIALFENA